jgi:large subunit ribosomal protein L18
MAKADRRIIRNRIHLRIRRKISGTSERPRLSVFFSGRHVYAQIIEDSAGLTLASVNTTESRFRSDNSTRANKQTAEKVGALIAERAKEKQIARVVFDRGGAQYHGKVKALADAARAGGLDF